MSSELKAGGVYAILMSEGLQVVAEGDHVGRVRTAAKEAVPKLVPASAPVRVAIVRVEAVVNFIPQLVACESPNPEPTNLEPTADGTSPTE